MRMRLVAGILVVAVALPACSNDASEAFCDAIASLSTFDRSNADADTLRELIADAVEAAPGEIEDQTRRFGEGIESLMSGDFDAGTDPEFKEASDDVNGYIRDNCETDR